jgi:DNA invertase Pin-like site-specific DNA recombinase
MLIGYARVSTQDQNLDLQKDALHKAGCEQIYEDRVSGTKARRPGLEQAFSHLRACLVKVRVEPFCGFYIG